MYNIDFIRLLLWHIPELMQFPVIMGYIDALIAPVKQLYNKFLDQRSLDLYRLAHNGQVCYLEAALNDRFDFAARRIYITDGNRYGRLYIYSSGEERPKFIYTSAETTPTYIFSRDDYSDTGADFIVNIPVVLMGAIKIPEQKALVNYYKLASKRHTIEWIS